MVAAPVLRIESQPRPIAPAGQPTETFRNLLREAVAMSVEIDPRRHLATNPDGVHQVLAAIEWCQAHIERGTEETCRQVLVSLLERQERLIGAGVWSGCTPACAALNERIREELAEEAPAGQGEVFDVLMPIWRALSEVCPPKRCILAGSVRRGKKNPHDVDFALMPRRSSGLFGDETASYPELLAVIERLLKAGTLRWDTRIKRNGPRQKRFVIPALNDMAMELYITFPDNFGAILAIRTGNADFTTGFVTRRQDYGLMPDDLRMVDGELTRYDWDRQEVIEKISVPTEASFFARLGLPHLPPEERNDVGFRRLRDLVRPHGQAVREALR